MMSATRVLQFWFEESTPANWFQKSDAFDAKIRGQFEFDAIEAAAILQRKDTHPWEADRHKALALIVMLDQFPRNMYRGTQAMFVWDEYALSVAKRAIASGFDLRTPQERRAFFYMPYMHSERLPDQSECVYLIHRGIDNPDTLHHAKQHKRVIERFGRFPHRNEALGRKSTPEEIAFLNEGGYTP